MTNWNACRSPLDIGFLATLCPICFKPKCGKINPLFMGGNMKMGNLLLNLRYLLAPILIIVAGAAESTSISANTNKYYRRVKVTNLM